MNAMLSVPCWSLGRRSRGLGRRWLHPGLHIIGAARGLGAFMTLMPTTGAAEDDRDEWCGPAIRSTWRHLRVGRVTGTFSASSSALWPRFMGQWGEAFGGPSREVCSSSPRQSSSHLHLRMATAEAVGAFLTGVPVVLPGSSAGVVGGRQPWMTRRPLPPQLFGEVSRSTPSR